MPLDEELQIATIAGVLFPKDATSFQIVPPVAVEKVGTITSGTASLSINTATGVTNGMYIFADGIPTGTTVSSGAGTTSLTLSRNATANVTKSRIVFYTEGTAGLIPLQEGSTIRFFR